MSPFLLLPISTGAYVGPILTRLLGRRRILLVSAELVGHKDDENEQQRPNMEIEDCSECNCSDRSGHPHRLSKFSY